ncbi:MAG TPA: hypothetical protein HA272_08885 [Methanoregula sp.]|nr:hypothetical protein [Methanoregula sp.]
MSIIVLILVMFILATPVPADAAGTVIPSDECAKLTVSYINNHLVAPGTAASLVSINETKGLYEINILYQSQQITLHTTRDCSMLFTSFFDIMKPRASAATTAEPIKSARPAVDLYVMSFCPYGTQAETVMHPVVGLLGEDADFKVRYITEVNGETIDSVSSLHGPIEAEEDAFQLCVQKKYPAASWEYLRLFNDQCYPLWQNSKALAACRKNVTATLKIDHDAMEGCASGAFAIELLRADSADSARTGAYSSPTLLVNGVKYYGARTPEAYKQFICNSFTTAPGGCSTVLSSAPATASAGACG